MQDIIIVSAAFLCDLFAHVRGVLRHHARASFQQIVRFLHAIEGLPGSKSIFQRMQERLREILLDHLNPPFGKLGAARRVRRNMI